MTSCPGRRPGSAAAPTTAPARCSGSACRRASSRAAPPPTETRSCRRSIRLGTPVRYVPGEATATFSFSYDGDVRTMTIDALGDAWSPGDVPELPSGRWVHVAPLARHEFPLETIAALAKRRRVSLDGQGLVRACRNRPAPARRRLRPRAAAPRLGAEARRRGGGGARRPRGARRARGRRHPRLARVDRVLRQARGARAGPRLPRATRPAPATPSRSPTSSRATRGSPPSAPRGAQPPSSRR